MKSSNIKTDATVATRSSVVVELRGCVQGVGLRSLAYSIASEMCISGSAKYSANGLLLTLHTDSNTVNNFVQRLLLEASPSAVIESFEIKQTSSHPEDTKHIPSAAPIVRPTPDLGLCPACRRELFDSSSSWFRFPFISCNSCGWRFSVTRQLPAIRENLTINSYPVTTKEEVPCNDNRRYLTETILSKVEHPAIAMLDIDGSIVVSGTEEVILAATTQLKEGKIIAIKDTGCFYLIADAASANAIQNIRNRKHSSKPFFLIYPDLKKIEEDFDTQEHHLLELQKNTGFLLLTPKKAAESFKVAATGLCKIGVTLPSTPLMQLVVHDFGSPLVVTSANISGEVILPQDAVNPEKSPLMADFTVTYDIEMTSILEESIIQYSSIKKRRMVVRRSRGMAPNFYGYTPKSERTLLATGASTRSGFALIHNKNTFISQNLGDNSQVQVQNIYQATLNHYQQLLNATPRVVLSDLHPNYFSHQVAERIAEEYRIPSDTVQHQKAHFAAILAENNLLNLEETVLGVIWDGAGLGDDGNYWGGEFFTYQSGSMSRVEHSSYFPYLIGDKMAMEPRISAIALMANSPYKLMLEPRFNEREWLYYNKLLGSKSNSRCSSMARVIDGVAALLNLCNRQSFEDNAAMILEDAAAKYVSETGFRSIDLYFDPNEEPNQIPNISQILEKIAEDIEKNADTNMIAYKFFCSLAALIINIAKKQDLKHIAFSGTVFQISLFVDILDHFYGNHYYLYFHKQLPPNDECVSFGQLVYYDQGIDSLFSDFTPTSNPFN